MSIGTIDIFHILAALAALLVAAHGLGFIANRIGIPPMVGELAGGVLIGTTVFARVWPEGHDWLLPAGPKDATLASAPVLPVLGFCSQIGLLLLMFIGGLQLKRLLTKRDAKAVGWITSLGVAIPVAAGLGLMQIVDFSKYMGSAHSIVALKIVLLIELAITSIPVITRIFMDLDLMNTRLARAVLSVAVIEDVMLYIALSMALSMADVTAKADASIPAWLNMSPDSAVFFIWHICASLTLLGVAAWGFGKVRGAEADGARSGFARLNLVARRSPVGWTIAMIFIITGVAMVLGLASMFGALVAGIVASNNSDPLLVKAQQQVEALGTSFFIPIYFALIGVTIDLVKDFDWKLTFGLLAFGSVVKFGGALLGGLVAGERPAMANAMAISVNARGGPGLATASTAFAAGIIDPRGYTSLVMLSIVTSVGAALFLARVLRSNPATTELIRGDGLGERLAHAAGSTSVTEPTRSGTLTPA